MDESKRVKTVKLDINFIKNYLDKIREMIAKTLGLEISEVSYRMASANLKKRLDAKGGLSESIK
jgi:hypothetical protein